MRRAGPLSAQLGKSPLEALPVATGAPLAFLIFVCSKNQWRSPTAKAIYRRDERVAVRSRGTAKAAVQTIRSDDIAWADVILVMEDKHRQRVLADFPGEAKFKPIDVLDIPDDYRFMDDELVELIRSAAEPIIASAIR